MQARRKWVDRCQQSFDELKWLCTIAPDLAWISPGLLNYIPMLVGLAWGLSSTRLMMMVWMLSLPMPVGVWQRLNLITLPTNLSFLPLNGLWLRNSTNTCMDQLLMSIQTIIPWPMSWQCESPMGGQPGQLQLSIVLQGREDQYQCGCLVKGVLARVHAWHLGHSPPGHCSGSVSHAGGYPPRPHELHQSI